jgi:hypothetical protein
MLLDNFVCFPWKLAEVAREGPDKSHVVTGAPEVTNVGLVKISAVN